MMFLAFKLPSSPLRVVGKSFSSNPGYYTSLVFHSFHTSHINWLNLNSPLIHSVDWGKVSAGYYAVADPMDTGSLIYLSDKEYRLHLRVSMSSDTPTIVIARPGDHEPDPRDYPATNPKPKTSPPRPYRGFHDGAKTYSSRYRKKFWYSVRVGGMVEPRQGNLHRIIAHWGNTLWVWNGFPATSCGLSEDFSKATEFLRKILLCRGSYGLICYLRISYVALTKYLSGAPLTSTWDLGTLVKLDRSGIPKWIPLTARHAIRSGHLPSIRLWMSTLYVYKALKVPISIERTWSALRTITTKRFEVADVPRIHQEFREFLRHNFIPSINGPFPLPTTKPVFPEDPVEVHPTNWPSNRMNAGPNKSPGILGAPMDAVLLRAEPALYQAVSDLLLIHGDTGSHGLSKLEEFSMDDHLKGLVSERIRAFFRPGKKGISRLPVLSRLHALYEAAGKVRIIAIIDYWSQRCLQPLHDFLFEVLKKIPNDGTMGQEELFSRLQKSIRSLPGLVGSSLDISSATDTIPVQLYEMLLEELFSSDVDFVLPSGYRSYKDYANMVIRVLTDREFLLPIEVANNRVKVNPSNIKVDSVWGVPYELPSSGRIRSNGWTVRYTRGQPMGALSSFSLLALLHHAIIQFAAFRVRSVDHSLVSLDDGNFYTYGVVGDDMAVLEQTDSQSSLTPVADEYLELCNIYSIPIKLIKSFKGTNGFFSLVSRNSLNGMEISPVSFKQELQVDSYSSRADMCNHMITRGYASDNPSLTSVLRMMGDHYDFICNKVYLHHGRLSASLHRSLFAVLTGLIRKLDAVHLDKSHLENILSMWVSLLSKVTTREANRVFRGLSNPVDSPYRGPLLLALALNLSDRLTKIKDGWYQGAADYLKWFDTVHGEDPSSLEARMFTSRTHTPPFCLPNLWSGASHAQIESSVSSFLIEVEVYKALLEMGPSDQVNDKLQTVVVNMISIFLKCSPSPRYQHGWLYVEALESKLEKGPSQISELIDIMVDSYHSVAPAMDLQSDALAPEEVSPVPGIGKI